MKLRYRVTFHCVFFRKFQSEIWKYVFQTVLMLKPRLIKKLRRILRFWNACCPLVTAFWDRMSWHRVSTNVSAEYSASSFKYTSTLMTKSAHFFGKFVTSLPYRSFHIRRCENFWLNSIITHTHTHTLPYVVHIRLARSSDPPRMRVGEVSE